MKYKHTVIIYFQCWAESVSAHGCEYVDQMARMLNVTTPEYRECSMV